jgi:ornithine carbamoyltransferase
MTLDEKYQHLADTISDINEHLPTLKKYAEECTHVTEMGVRWIVSTYAFLAARPETMVSIDMQHPSKWKASIEDVENYANEINCKYKFWQANNLEIEIEETDLLFIDTWHSYKQLKSELELHASKVRKYIIVHDTVLFGTQDELNSYDAFGWFNGFEQKGLMPALNEFLEGNEEWTTHEVFTNNNGLIILKRK